MENLNDIIFYTIEKSIKSYRQFAQRNITEAGFDITIDQWLVLKTIEEDSVATQQQIAAKAFKDIASITRIIELLVKKNFVLRDFHTDRRRFDLSLTDEGKDILVKVQPIITSNRKTALTGLSESEINTIQLALSKIIISVQ